MARPLAGRSTGRDDKIDKAGGRTRRFGVLPAAAAIGSGAAIGWYLERLMMDRLVPPDGISPNALLEPVPDGTTGYVTAGDGCRIAYVETGQGPATLVLLHGFAADRSVWGRIQQRLSDDHRVVAVDSRGHGASDVRAVDRPVAETHAHDIAALLEELGLEDVVLVGHALGGMSALQFLVDHPEVRDRRVKGCVLLGTVPSTVELDRNGRRLDAEETARRRRLWEAFTSTLARSIEPGTYLKRARSDAGLLFARSLFGRKGNRSTVAAALELAIRTPPVTVAGDLRAISGYDVLDGLDSVPTQCLVLVGERDIVTPIPYSIALERELRDARLHTILGAGHMLMFEEPDLTVRLFREFTRSLVRSA